MPASRLSRSVRARQIFIRRSTTAHMMTAQPNIVSGRLRQNHPAAEGGKAEQALEDAERYADGKLRGRTAG